MLRSIAIGTPEMATTDFMRANFNVEYALNRLRFTLAPRVIMSATSVTTAYLEDGVTYMFFELELETAYLYLILIACWPHVFVIAERF
jgi:hypothetical protein